MNPPHTDFAKEIRMSTVFPQSIDAEPNSIFFGQFISFIAILCQESILCALEVPLLLVSKELTDKECEPDGCQQKVNGVKGVVVGEVDGGREPLDEDDLIVGNEEQIEEFTKDPVIVLSDIGPPIVFSPFLEPSFPPKIECVCHSPQSHHSQHHKLTSSNRNISTTLLMIEVVNSKANRQQGPQSINPRILVGQFAQSKTNGGNGKCPAKCVLH